MDATKFSSTLIFGSSTSVIVQLSDAIKVYKSLRNEQTKERKQTDEQKN